MSSFEAPAMQQLPHSGAMSLVSTNQPRTNPQLRRATYIHVSDLTNAYNIDHAKLEEELARVKAERESSAAEEAKPRSNSLGGVPTELDTSYPAKRLQPPRGGNNMVVLVGKVRIVVDKNRVDGSRVRLAEVDVGDETGMVSLRARDNQIDTLQEISDRSGSVVLRNCTLELYKGKHIRLAVTKWGKLSAYPDQVPSTPAPPSKINRDRNFSLINLTLVASEMVQTAPSQHQQSDYQQGADTESQASQQGPSSQMGGRGGPQQARQSSGGGRGGRRPSRGKPSAGVHYGESAMRPYQQGGSLHHAYAGGGFATEPLGMPQYYARPQEPLSSSQHQQQMLLQQQFEMQQRQMQQLYHGGGGSQNPQQQQQRQSSVQSSPLVSQGGIVPTASFESYSPGSEQGAGIPAAMPPSSQFMMPIHSPTPPSPHLQHQTSGVSHSSRSESPLSPGKMNPQAATFDPSSKFQQQNPPG